MTTTRHGFRISSRQQWIVQRQAGTAPFEARLVVEIAGPLDPRRLAAALSGLVGAHDILQTRFVTRTGLRWPIQVIEGASAEGATAVETSVVSAGPGVHVLTLRLPALCADTRALGLMFEELVDRYAGAVVAPPALQYAHYADWQLEQAERAPVAAPGARLVLPGEQTSGARAVHDREELSFAIERTWIDRLVAAAGPDRRPAHVLLAAWLAVLGRLADARTVGCRVACAGRRDADLATMLGPIDRYVALDLALDRSVSFAALVDHVAGALLDAERQLGHGEQEPSDASDGEAEADIGFDLHELPRARRVDDTRFRVQVQTARLERFKLRLSCTRDAGELRCALAFDPAVFSRAAIAELAGAYVALVRHAAEAPAQPIGALRLLDRAAEDHVLALSQGPAGAASSPLPERFADQVRRTPEAIAVEASIGAELRWSYAELADRARRLAHRLQREAVGPEIAVAVVLEPSAALIVALLAIHQAGGVYVPIDPRDPPRRLAAALAAVPPRVVITRDELVASLPPLAAVIVVLDAVGSFAGADAAASIAPVRVDPDHLAYVMFTSGSTGEPKAVGVSHRALASYLDWCQTSYAFDPARAAWIHSSASFDLGLTALIAPLVMGRRLRFLPLAERPETLGEMLRDADGLGLLKLTPSHLRALRHQLPAGPALDGVVLVIGGESLYHEDLELLGAASRSIRIINEYGPTEATVGCSTHELVGETARGRTGPVSIGRPIPGARMYVLDDELQPLPIGVTGALYIGGAGLARGYLGAPAQTAARFVPDPFSAAPGQRLYRTGDLARLGARGDFEFLGRDDDQVKIRGHRVELGDIERALRQHPAVGDAAVLVQHGDRPGATRLLAFVAPRAGTARTAMPGSEELRALLRQWLPEAVVPGAIAVLDRLHRAASGKLDRAALEAAAAALGGPGVAPRDELEQILAGVWSQVLATPTIHIDDNFFALGGDSIRALQVVALARARFVELSLDKVFTSPTVRSLAARARAAHPEAALAPTSPFSLIGPQDRAVLAPDEDVVDAFPLAALQAGMIFHNDQSALYHDIFSFHVEAPFDERHLRAAANALVARHPAFRTTFDLDRFSLPLQLVHRTGPDPLTVEDLRALSPEDQTRAIADHLDAERRRGLDVARLPLIRFHVQRRTDTTLQLNLSFHHAVIDGWSDATMMSELFHDYLSTLANEPSGLTAPVASFRDFIVLEQAAMTSAETAEFWDRALAGSTLFRLPGALVGDRPDGERRLVRRIIDLPEEVAAGIRALALELAVPVKTVLLAAHFAAMRVMQGDGDVLSCMVSSGRIETTDGDRVLGLFINSIPIRARLDGGTWRDLVHEMLRVERELMPHRRLPLAELQRRRGGLPLSDVLFYFTDYHVYRSRSTLPRLKLIDYIPHEETSFPLSVSFSIDPVGPGIQFELVADEARFARDTVDSVERCVLAALRALTTVADERYELHPLLSDDAGAVAVRDGQPIQVLDAWRQPVPVGVLGRIYAGDQRTDELARRRADGAIEPCGPVDRLVRVRGVRVALGELEAALATHPAVHGAAIVAFGEPDALVLAAYVASADPAVTAQAVRDHLLRRFPETVVPSHVVIRDRLPTAADGTIDRAQLADPRDPSTGGGEAFEAPATEVEQLIAALWQETLGVARVGRRDQFFALGGHSIVLVRVVSRLRKALQLRVPIRMLHDHPMLADLARAIEELRTSGVTQAAPSFAAGERPEAAPLSFVQEGIWQIERSGAAGPAYHIPVAIRIDGALDRAALAAALDLVVARHAALRTSVTETEAGAVQRVLPAVASALVATEATSADPEELRAWMQAELARPFELASGSVIRAALRSHGARDHVLLLVVHHLAVDGWSMGVVFRDLVELYRGRVSQDALALPPITSSYAAYATWQRAQEDSAAWDGHRAYWRARLAQLPPPLDLAQRGARPHKRSYRGERLPLAIPEATSQTLRELARAAETTLYVVVLAAFKVVLAHRGAQRDIVVGTDVAGRELPGTEDLVGCIVNQVVLRTRLPSDEDPTFRAVLALVRATVLEAYDHQDLPFELVLRELKPRREPGLPPVFQIKMVFQRAALDRRELPDVAFEPIALDTGAAKWDLLLDVWDGPDGIGGALTYSEDLLDRALAKHLIAGLSSVLAQVAADPDAALGQLEQALTREAEAHRRALAAEAAQTSRRLFERSRRARPVALDQELVRTRPLDDGAAFPLCVEPAVRGVDLVAWAAQSRGWIDDQLDRHGALLFRGFEVAGTETFERFMVSACGPLLSYDERSSPRKAVHGRVYTSTEYPADQSIFFHNENSYQNRFPTRLGFHCVKPAERGGETPLAHCGRALRRIPRDVLARFVERGWMCVRNYREELGLPWQEVFQTQDRAEVEARCRRDGLVFEWHGARLTTRAVRPALARHPRTTQLSWFNHAAFFHVSTLDEALREGLLAELGEDELPANTYYGNGAPIEPEALDAIRQAYQAEAVYPAWQRGDITLVDNLVVAHGRAPFSGPRTVLVAMAALVERAEVDPSAAERAAALGEAPVTAGAQR